MRSRDNGNGYVDGDDSSDSINNFGHNQGPLLHYHNAHDDDHTPGSSATFCSIIDDNRPSPTIQMIRRHHNPRRRLRRRRCIKLRKSTSLLCSTTATFLLLLLLQVLQVLQVQVVVVEATSSTGGGYLTSPRSRNYIAYQHNKIFPSSTHPLSSLPENEPTPHSLGGQTSCGTADGNERNYNSPKSRMGQVMPLNIQGIYSSQSESESDGTDSATGSTGTGTIDVTINLFNTDGGGHFEFSACPITFPDVPTEACFEKYPLTFVRDNHYGAVKDMNYPNRAYVPYESAFTTTATATGGVAGAGNLQKVIRNESPLGPTGTMMEFSYTLQLPPNAKELNTDYNELETSGIPNGDVEKSVYTVDIINHYNDEDRRRQRERRERRKRRKLWLAVQHGDKFAEADYETVVISSMSTDGNGTTTITTLGGEVTILTHGPMIPKSSTLTFGAKAIYGEGIPIDQLPTHVQDELSEIEQDYSPGSSSTAASNLRPSKDIPVEEGGAGGPISSSATSFASTTSGSEPESEPLLQSYAESISESYSSSSSSSSTIDVAPPNNRYVILRWRYVTAHDCHPAGYDAYPWPSSWGKWTPNWAGECDANNGNQQVYHNCAEILILGSGTKLVPQAESLQESQESPVVSAADVTEIFANNDYAKTMGRNPVKIDVTANDIGAPFLRVAGTRNGRHGSCSVTKDNQVIYTANDDNWYDHSRAAYGGKDRCAYMACIENGNKDEVEVCDEGKIYIEVNPDPSIEIVNSLTPLLASEGTITAYDDGAVTGIDQPIRIKVITNDKFPSNFSPIVTAIHFHASHGNCETYNNQVLYTPHNGFAGWDHCYYRVCLNTLSLNICDEARITIRVLGDIIPDTPDTSQPDLIEPIPYTIPQQPDLITDQPMLPDLYTSQPDLIEPIPYTIPEQPNPITDQPNPITDQPILPDLSKVDDTIKPAEFEFDAFTTNWDVMAYPDTVNVPEGNTVDIDVLENDNGNGLMLDSWTNPSSGANVAEVHGQLRYTANEGFTGDDSFEYTVCDTDGRCDTTTVDVHVFSKALADEILVTTPMDTPVIIDTIVPDIASVNRARNGECKLMPENHIKYTPSPSFVGRDRCAYIVCSDEGQCDKGKIDVRVTDPIDDNTPVKEQSMEYPKKIVYAEDEIVTTEMNTPITIDVTGNDFTHGMNGLKLTITDGAENGKCRLTDDNQVHFVPNENFIGKDNCVYEICKNSICDEGIIGIDVVPQSAAMKPMLEEQDQSSGNGLVSNYDSSGKMTLASVHKGEASSITQGDNLASVEIPEISSSSSNATNVDCEEIEDGSRKLRGSRRLNPCPESSHVTITKMEKPMSTTSTHKKKKRPVQM